MHAGRYIAALLWLTATAALAQGDPQRAFDSATAAVRRPGTVVRIDLIGDSTQTQNAGYGRGFCANLSAAVDCVNMARGGASTKTYREDGLWQHALATKPDYMVIQFGHNDAVDSANPLPRQVPLPEYIANLKRFVVEARAAGIRPVLVTPLTRRYFASDGKVHSDLGAYADAMRRVARELTVPLIELHDQSIAFLDRIGATQADALAITKKDAGGKTVFDKTHLNWQGSYVFGRMVAEDLGHVEPSLLKYVRSDAAVLPGEGVRALQVLRGAPVRIVLVGDSTVATGGGWGPGFCAVMTKNVTCDDVARNGRSSKSFIDEGSWAKALALKGDYYLIQFGHNDEKDDPARHTDPQTTFRANIERMVADVEAQHAVPVVVSPLARRTFVNGKPSNDDLKAYADVARAVAADNGITFIDLLSLSERFLATMTQSQADDFDATAHADAKAENNGRADPSLDRTHLNAKGQAVFGRMVADNLVRTQVELGPDVIGAPAAIAVPQQAAPADSH